jgi:hypothetical protein
MRQQHAPCERRPTASSQAVAMGEVIRVCLLRRIVKYGGLQQ